MSRNTKNKIKRKKSFKEKRTGKIMSKLSAMTEDLTVQLSEALSQIKVRDFDSVVDFVNARTQVISEFDATRKEMLEAVRKLNTTEKTRF
ncbi:MAG: hypothetical protein JKY15_01930 [Deltaproteobacteria bacterium]|nr:hypothetical protein [Deltaproteobacteria bacterium]